MSDENAVTQDLTKWFGENHRADLLATAGDGVNRAFELVITKAELVSVEAKDGVPTPVLRFEAKYISKREPNEDEVVDQSVKAPQIEDVGFIFRMAVADEFPETAGDDTAGR